MISGMEMSVAYWSQGPSRLLIWTCSPMEEFAILPNGYASSATCSPSRYALLTGTYPWRNADAQISSVTAPHYSIGTTQLTFQNLKQNKGSIPAVIGSGHGLRCWNVDWNEENFTRDPIR